MTFTAAQVRQACVLLRWKAPRLSRHARISYKAALNARKDDGISTVSETELWAIRTSLEAAGIRFEIDPDGQPCAVLSKAEP